MFKDFLQNPITNPLKTPSGKIEISSKAIANFNLSDCPSHPQWLEPHEWLGKIDKYSLHLISNQPTHRLHSQLDNAISSQIEKIDGRESVFINPIDAEKRNIKSRDFVNLINDRGSFLSGTKITDVIMSGVVVLSTGAWFDTDENISLERHGNPNVLTKDVGTSSLGQGPTSHTTLVEMKKANPEIINNVKIFKIQKNK